MDFELLRRQDLIEVIKNQSERILLLEDNLMWRDATKETPEINKEVLFKINNNAIPYVWRFDGEFWWTDNGNYVKAKDGNQWLPIPKE